MACSTEPAAVRDAEAVAASLAPLVVGGVAVETADLLRGRDEAEDEELYIERVLSMRDFVLRGTKAGYASVVLLGEGSLRAIIGDALALGAESAEGIERDDALPAASLSVLDFGDGSWPAIVAEAPPAVRCLGYVPS